MTTINIRDYVVHGLFLENIKDDCPYDVIIFEKKPDDIRALDEKIVSLDDLDSPFAMRGTIARYITDKKNILLILDTVPAVYFLPFLQLSDVSLTIVNTVAGTASLGHKVTSDTHDVVTLLSYDMLIYEPYDVMSFIHTITQPTNKYIRITYPELLSNIFTGQDDVHDMSIKDVVSLIPHGYAGDQSTVVTSGGLAMPMLQAVQGLHNQGIFVDLFIAHLHNSEITHELRDSLLKTEKLVFIIDHQPSMLLMSSMKAKLRDKGLFDVDVQYIWADHTNATAMNTHDKYAQAGLDAQGLADRTHDVLT